MTRRERAPQANKRSAARLAALQTLYEVELMGSSLEKAMDDFNKCHKAINLGEEHKSIEIDNSLYEKLALGAIEVQEALDAVIKSNLPPEWSFARLDIIILINLRLGIYEILYTDTPTAIILNEYIDLIKAFYEGKAPGFINGVLDGIAKRFRSDEAVT